MATKTGLVLQGGGALGAYQLGALKYFYEKDPEFSPAIVTGVSIGAVNAAVMVGGKQGPIKSLEELWQTLKMPSNPLFPSAWQAKISKFGNPSMYFPNPELVWSPFTADSLYKLAPFHDLISRLIDFEKLNNSPTEVVVEAVNVETGEQKRFSNHKNGGLNPERVIASMSIPPNFPAVHTDMNYYWDGGLFANMPLSPAINFLEQLPDPEGKELERELIVINLFRKNSPMPRNIEAIGNRIKEIMFESKLKLDRSFFEKTNELTDFFGKLNRELAEDDPLRKHPAFERMLTKKDIRLEMVLQYENEGVEGTDDFTPEAVDSRVRQGYRDAKANFEN